MDNNDYKKALTSARQELESLEEKREEIGTRIVELKQTIVGLAKLCREKGILASMAKEIEATGITDNCREILKASWQRSWTPIEVKDQLLKMGLDASKYTNLLASIHSVLKRLVESREVAVIPLEDGTVAYRWLVLRFPRHPRHRRSVSYREPISIPPPPSDLR